MSYTFLLEQGEESSAECYSGIPQSVLSRSSHTAETSSSNGNVTESCPGSLSGMMSAHSTGCRGEEKRKLSAADFRASMSHPQESEKELWVKEVVCGGKCSESFAKFDQDSSLWKTHQVCWIEGWETFSDRWPRAGMIRDGIAFQRAPLVQTTYETEFISWRQIGRPKLWMGPEKSGYYPTPRAVDNGQIKTTRTDKRNKTASPTLSEILAERGGMKASTLEWMMGWPIGWSDASKPLGTGRFRQWLDWLGIF